MKKTESVFNGKPIRIEYDEKSKEWLFSAVDAVAALAEPSNPRRYWSDIKRRLSDDQLYAKIVQLKMRSSDGKSYMTDALNRKGLVELTRHLKSPHTGAFIEWLTQFDGAERKFILKHKDVDVAEVELDGSGSISSVGEILNEAHMPIGTGDMKFYGTASLKDWWSGRSIPASREGLREFLDSLGMRLPQELLHKSFGLSLSDQYWICPRNEDIRWEKMNFFHNAFSEDVGELLFGRRGIKNGYAIDLLSPDNTSDGILKKKWKIINGKRCLIKGGSKPNNQEVANEVLASRICKRLGIPFVKYEIMEIDGDRYCVCEDFITGETELVTAYHVRKLIKKDNSTSDYESYVRKAEELGIKDARQRTEMMLVLDFIIANTDRHYNNFGLIRNADTLQWLSVAPVYDSGTSMWCMEFPSAFNSGREESKPFRNRHDRQIMLVNDFSWLNFDALDGIEDEYAEILLRSVRDPSALADRNEWLCSALRARIGLLKLIAGRKQK